MLLLTLSQPSIAQTPPDTHSVSLQGVPLADALERFASATGVALSYSSDQVHEHRVYCVVKDAPLESALACILDGSGLTYHRLASGTYMLTVSPETESPHGHLSGTVTDADADVPLAHAHVWLVGTNRGTTTNRAGQFVFPSLQPGTYAVQVSHVGYAPWRDTLHVAPHNRTHLNASLTHEPLRINPLIVDGIQHHGAHAHSSETAVEADDPPIGYAASYVGAYQALGALAGIRLNNVTSDLHVQGGDAGAATLRLDGVPVHLPRTTTFGHIGPFNPLAIARIDVHSAGSEAAQGRHGVGVIDATHRQPNRAGSDVQVDPLSLKATGHGTHTFDSGRTMKAMGTARIGLWNVYAPPALNRRLQAWSAPDLFPVRTAVENPTAPPEFGNQTATPNLNLTDLHGSVQMDLSPLQTLHASGYHGQRSLQGRLRSEGVSAGENGPLFTVNDGYGWTNTLGQLSYDAVVGDRTLLTTQARASRYTLRHQYEVLSADTTDGTDYTPLSLADGNSVQSAALEGTLEHAYGNHHLHVGTDLEWIQSEFLLYGARFASPDSAPVDLGIVSASAASPRAVSHHHARMQWSTFARTTWNPTTALSLTGGVRLTYHPPRTTVYAEPHVSLRVAAPNRIWSMRTTAGWHRHFTHQADVSVLNTGALQSAMRVWLPLDATVRPPQTARVTQEWVVEPTAQWTLRAEGYGSWHPHHLTMQYASAQNGFLTGRARQQSTFLADAQGYRYGGSLTAAWRGEAVQVQLRYEYGQAQQQSPVRFDGRWVSAPSREPHRIEGGFDWDPLPHLTASLRGHGVWGRTWGFRRAYYDYFGHDDTTRQQGPFDLGQPDAHALPPLYRVDLSLAYTRSVQNVLVQARIDLHNVTGRANVAEWRLVEQDHNWHRSPQLLPSRFPSIALRIGI